MKEMKKLICVAAAFAMVAGVASVASAEVNLSGDARARIRYNDAGVGNSISKWDSRIRFKLEAKTESGGYVKARLRFLDGTWGLGNDYKANAKGDSNVWSDYAFLGFKKGNLDVAAGKMPLAFSPWFLDDERADRFRVLYKTGGTALAFTFDKKIYEYKDLTNTVNVSTTLADGNVGNILVQVPGNPLGGDKDVYGVTFRQKFSDAAKMGLRMVWVADSTNADKDGLKASINTEMNFAGNKIEAEFSFKDGDTATIGSDDQLGGYVGWSAAYGDITPSVKAGFTKDGFTADETFGWLMVGGDVPTSNIARLGQSSAVTAADTIFAGASSGFQASEDLSFQANLVYLDIDGGHLLYGENPIEVSGQAKYMVGKGISLIARAGWLGSDGDADDAVSAYGQMEVTF
jgi:hypothetical protein